MTSLTTDGRATPHLPRPEAAPSQRDSLPLGGLLALAMAGFITILTEALPAGLLPQMSADLAVAESWVGQLVTMYAVGSLLAAIPLTAATRQWRRRPLLLIAIGGFAIVNTLTALSTNYVLTLGARFVAGVFAGLLWSLLAGYASRMVPAHLRGRAIAVAMIGTPLALSLGIPFGTFIGAAVGWRVTFGIMSLLTVILIGWIQASVPDFSGQTTEQRRPLAEVFSMPGVRPVLLVTLTFVLAHNVMYTYVAPFLVLAGIVARVDVVLLLFGATALLGIWIVGAFIDRFLRELVLMSTVLFGLAALALALWGTSPAATCVAIGIWGFAFGGAATLFQTASANAAGEAADVAQAMIVTAWNIAIAGGGIVGGVLLDTLGAASLPWAVIVLLLPTLCVAWLSQQDGFPAAKTP